MALPQGSNQAATYAETLTYAVAVQLVSAQGAGR